MAILVKRRLTQASSALSSLLYHLSAKIKRKHDVILNFFADNGIYHGVNDGVNEGDGRNENCGARRADRISAISTHLLRSDKRFRRSKRLFRHDKIHQIFMMNAVSPYLYCLQWYMRPEHKNSSIEKTIFLENRLRILRISC